MGLIYFPNLPNLFAGMRRVEKNNQRNSRSLHWDSIQENVPEREPDLIFPPFRTSLSSIITCFFWILKLLITAVYGGAFAQVRAFLSICRGFFSWPYNQYTHRTLSK